MQFRVWLVAATASVSLGAPKTNLGLRLEDIELYNSKQNVQRDESTHGAQTPTNDSTAYQPWQAIHNAWQPFTIKETRKKACILVHTSPVRLSENLIFIKGTSPRFCLLKWQLRVTEYDPVGGGRPVSN